MSAENLDELIRAADPLRAAEVPDVDSELGQDIFHRALAGAGEPAATELSGDQGAALPGDPRRLQPGRAGRRGSSARRALTLVSVAALALGIVLVGVGVVPTPLTSSSPAGASELDSIAAKAASQPGVTLGPGQYLWTRMSADFVVEVQAASVGGSSQRQPAGPPGSGLGNAATATVPASLESWANGAGSVYYRNRFAEASFASASERAAWQAAGLALTPVMAQPVTGSQTLQSVSGHAGGPYAPGFGALDVAALPTDPARLGPELRRGTTGIPALDDLSPALSGGAVAAEFDRAVLILLGPAVGGSPALDAAVYRVLASMAGIHELGRVADHAGRSGLGFSLDSTLGPVGIVVDPATGALLEARGQPLAFGNVEEQVADQYLLAGARSPGVGAGLEVSATYAWIDPAGPGRAVGASALPRALRG